MGISYKKLFQHKFIIVASIFYIYLLSIGYSAGIFFPYHLNPQNLFILGLIGINFKFPFLAFCLFSFLSFFLFAAIILKFQSKFIALPLLIYAFSPWFSYLTVVESNYIYFLFFILIAAYSLILQKHRSKYLGMFLFFLSGAILIYSSITMAVMFLFLVPALILVKCFKGKAICSTIIFFILTYLILVFTIYKHLQAFENIFQNQIMIFSNPGVFGESNRLQADSKHLGYTNLARISENRYVYASKYSINKILRHFTPATYFSAQEKLLMFSFTPPIMLGFLLPFVIGLYSSLTSIKFSKYLLILPILVIPSVLSQKIVDLNRLVIIGPAVILLISQGVISLIQNLNFKKLILLFCIFIVVLIQLLFTISDMKLRENLRYHKYFGENLSDEIGRQ